MRTLADLPVTKRQMEIYQWICDYVATHGYSPTVREGCKHFKFASPQGIVCHLRSLRRRGMIDWIDGKARTLRPTEVQA